MRLYFSPATGGSAADREFFDFALPRKIKNEQYTVADSEDGADILVSVTLTENTGGPSAVTLGLAANAGEGRASLLELSMSYVRPEELYAWNLGFPLRITMKRREPL